MAYDFLPQHQVVKRYKYRSSLLCVFSVFIFLISFILGQYEISFFDVIKILLNYILPFEIFTPTWDDTAYRVVIYIRLPRIILSSCVGIALSVAGTLFQAVFRNPLVSPSILGASNGAAFGAALAILLGYGNIFISVNAFIFGMISMFVVLTLSKIVKAQKILAMILCGILVSSLFQAGLSLLKLNADPNNTLPAITYWLMGSFASANIYEIPYYLPIALIVAFVISFSWKINILTLDEIEAKALGINTTVYQYLLIVIGSLLTSIAVAFSGVVSWIGLIVPHMARFYGEDDHSHVLWNAIFIGMSFTICIDNISRLLLSSEIPIGILTALIGAPLYLYLIVKAAKNDKL